MGMFVLPVRQLILGTLDKCNLEYYKLKEFKRPSRNKHRYDDECRLLCFLAY